MAASASFRFLSPPAPNPHDRIHPSLLACPTRRRRLRATRCSSTPQPPPSPRLEFPLLPFQPAEVLIPSECKTLHLYEARYLALLEEALYKRQNSLVHFVLDPVLSSSSKDSFAVRYGCLVQIESVQKLDFGALVSIRGVCRVNIKNLLQMEPYLRGDVSPMMDKSCDGTGLGLRISRLRESMCNLHSLQMKLKVPEDEPLQTNIKSSLMWSEKETFEGYDEEFIPGLVERLSFAAYQSVSGMSDAELLTLQKYKIKAMDSTDTLERVNSGIEYVEHNIGMVAARLAIQNI
ncbi:hypothetical protein CFC21_061019 [Triticum aestivum]|uniref:Lon N-terminal domain-containing protein n=4 Tax=Triticinae TaxID=1648030 RepID=A0A9R1KGG2_WHEAT|nr:uncharacterized protein LOC123096370 [Triticum aestivum]KAF7053020.1 hypothetical protein CFC21_061019 [Triticum aestivum]